MSLSINLVLHHKQRPYIEMYTMSLSIHLVSHHKPPPYIEMYTMSLNINLVSHHKRRPYIEMYTMSLTLERFLSKHFLAESVSIGTAPNPDRTLKPPRIMAWLVFKQIWGVGGKLSSYFRAASCTI